MGTDNGCARKVSSRGQVVLPQQVRASLGLRSGDQIEFVEIDSGTWAIRKVVKSGSFKRFAGAFRDLKQLPLDADDFLDEVRGSLARQGDEG